MKIEFDHSMFNTETVGVDGFTKVYAPGSDFVRSDGGAETCLTSREANAGYELTTDFSDTCGTVVSMENSMISFKKTLQFGNVAGITLDNTQIFLAGSNKISVTFNCKYSTSASATSAAIEIETPIDVSGAVTAANGKFDTALSIKFYDATYNTEITAPAPIGSTVYPMVSWSVDTLVGTIGFYVKSCQVVDVDDADQTDISAKPQVAIISGSCYSKVVEAKPFGVRYVDRFAKFSYKSFSFDTTTTDTQKLSCEIEFCFESTCTNALTTTSLQCPKTTGYTYSFNGVN